MIALRRADDRGRTELDWLDGRHTFSFGEYRDPEHVGFRALRVINEDRVRPGKGFGTHPHRDMEIFTWVLAGALEHKDSLGNGSVIRPGDAQRMTAGTGILHSEVNPSPDEEVQLLQIWILPERDGLEPGYEQRHFSADERRGRLLRIVTRDGAEGALSIHQDVDVFNGLLAAGDRVAHALRTGRHAWLQVARGDVELNGHALGAGDGAAVSEESELSVVARSDAEVLLFDLA